MLNKISLLSLSVLAVACVVEEKDTGVDDTSATEPAAEASTEPATEPAAEPAEETYTGPLPDGSLPGCLLEMDGVTNSGLYCFEGAWITAENCNNSYLVFQAGGCSPDSIVAVCLDIPADGDYLDVSDGYYYDGAVGTEDACGSVGGSWEYIAD